MTTTVAKRMMIVKYQVKSHSEMVASNSPLLLAVNHKFNRTNDEITNIRQRLTTLK